jgi:hypothetical protein
MLHRGGAIWDTARISAPSRPIRRRTCLVRGGTAATGLACAGPCQSLGAHKPSVSLRPALPSESRRDTLPVSTPQPTPKDSILKPPRLLVADPHLPQPANHYTPCPCLAPIYSWIYSARTTPIAAKPYPPLKPRRLEYQKPSRCPPPDALLFWLLVARCANPHSRSFYSIFYRRVGLLVLSFNTFSLFNTHTHTHTHTHTNSPWGS